MTDIAAPVKKTAKWRLVIEDSKFATNFVDVSRTVEDGNGDTIRLQGSAANSAIVIPVAKASQLAGLLTVADEWWTGADVDQPVDAEIIDDRPHLDYHLLVECFIASRPQWMTRGAAEEHGHEAVRRLQSSGQVVITRNGEVWLP